MEKARREVSGFWWRVLGWAMLVLGIMDVVAHHQNYGGGLPFYHLGSRDRAWAWLIIGAVALCTGEILQAIAGLPARIAAVGKPEAPAPPGGQP
jgi:hypothetical protein